MPAALAISFLALLVLFGGASRADAQSQPLIRLGSLVLGLIGLWHMRADHFRAVRRPLQFLGVYALVCILHLVPLPPGLWAALPGRGVIARGIEATGFPAVWRPLSFVPDLTINALLAMLPAVAAVVLMSILPRRHFAAIPLVLLGVGAFSALLGLSQVFTGSPYPYKVTNLGTPVGIFANRNHAALLLSTMLPLAVSAAAAAGPERGKGGRLLVAGLAVLVIVLPLLLINGSRGGLVCAAIGILGAGAMAMKANVPGFDRRRAVVGMAAIGLGVVALGAIFLLAGRDVALGRLLSGGPDPDIRLRALPTILEMVRTYFPVGSGVGTFAPVFMIAEPDALVSSVYLNHAHNDLLEIASDAGIVGVGLLTWLVVWSIRRSLAAWRSPSADRMEARLGSVILAQMLVASALDYPVRTPFMGAMLFFALTCLALPARRASAPERQKHGHTTSAI